METNSEEKRPKKMLGIALSALAAVLFLAGAILTLRQYVFIPGRYEAPPAPTPAPVEEQVVVPEPDGTFITETPEPTPYIQLIPVKIYFTERSVMADIVPVGVIMEGEKTGKMETVNDAILTAWYRDGPSPGEEGNALINGHVRWKGKAGTFSILPDLKTGEEVVIEYDDGTTRSFRVSEVNFYDRTDIPAEAMELDWGGAPRMTLISCTGEFDHAAGTSSIRVFVVCVPA